MFIILTKENLVENIERGDLLDDLLDILDGANDLDIADGFGDGQELLAKVSEALESCWSSGGESH